MKYIVEISERLSRLVTVDARNEDEARSIVSRRYESEEIVLDWSDCTGTEITIVTDEAETI